jgi:hypothetical protein
LWSELKLSYKGEENQTFDNKNVYKYSEWIDGEYQYYYYVFINNKAYQIVESAEDNWKYLIPQQQAQIEVNTNQK